LCCLPKMCVRTKRTKQPNRRSSCLTRGDGCQVLVQVYASYKTWAQCLTTQKTSAHYKQNSLSAMLPVQLNGTRQHTFSSKVSLRRCRKVQWGAVLGLSLLFFGLMSVVSVLPGRMAQAHHCSKLTDNSWLSRMLQAAGQQSSSSLPATAYVSQAVVQAFTAVHAAAEQGLQPADMLAEAQPITA
jgi:hypothetical protein